MRTLRLLDFEITLPRMVRVSVENEQSCTTFYTLRGRGLDDLRRQIEQVGAAHKYDVKYGETAFFLRRKEQFMGVFALAPTRLGVRVYDGESLPHARTWERGIVVGRFSIPLPDGVSVDPRRECKERGRSASLTASWHLRGAAAREVAEMIHDHFVLQGLRSGGVWPPPAGGILRWNVEASSTKTLMQAKILEGDEHLELDIQLIGKELMGKDG